ncbi:MAG TPA: ATP-dependent DNA helicase RecG, partial [Trebonia sp.]
MTRFDEPLKLAVGDKTAAPLESALGISTVGELLRHYPRRYAERGELTPIASLEHDDHVTVVGRVSAVQRRPMKNRQGTWLDVEVTDGKDRLRLAFFGKGAYVAEQRLLPGTEATFS